MNKTYRKLQAAVYSKSKNKKELSLQSVILFIQDAKFNNNSEIRELKHSIYGEALYIHYTLHDGYQSYLKLDLTKNPKDWDEETIQQILNLITL